MNINYFGTSLTAHGHYMFEISDRGIYNSDIRLESLPFSPETLNRNSQFGTVNRVTFNNYRIIAITGSCYDKRGGTKSVFWIEDAELTVQKLEEIIKANPVCQKMFTQMDFDINW